MSIRFVSSRMAYLSLLVICTTSLSCSLFGNSKGGFLHSPGPVLFISNESGTAQLYSMNPDGSDVRQLTSNQEAPVDGAVWAPDGRSIALTGLVNKGPGQNFEYLYLVSANGSFINRISKENSDQQCESDSSPVWSSDARRIVFGKRTGCGDRDFPKRVHIVNSDGREMRMLEGDINRRQTTITDWINDDTMLLGHSNKWFYDGQSRVSFNYITFWSVDGDSITSFGEYGTHHSWPILSSSGNEIAFKTTDGSTTGLYRTDLTGANRFQIAGAESPPIKPIGWTPDDTWILARGSVLIRGHGHRDRILRIGTNGDSVEDISPCGNYTCLPTSLLQH